MNRAYIAFGANLSNPRETLMRSVEALADSGVLVDRVSNLWRSPAWPPGSGAPDYRNAVMAVRTGLEPGALMGLLLRIETTLGRTRSAPNAPRSCDLDLLDYAGLTSADPHCTLPHPRMAERDFVLLPLAEVVEEGWRHPASGKGVKDLLARLA
ncbi:MAG: 2-amino-4-hydroxy-6-hydroxymethyldihydropteridine diphosphokinase [Litorimonas sp.]